MLNCFGCVLKRSLSLAASKVTFVRFYLTGGLHAVSMGKPSERMLNFWTVRFLKIESEPNFGFPHITNHSLAFEQYLCSWQLHITWTASRFTAVIYWNFSG